MQKWVNFISGGGSTNLAILEAEKPGGVLYGISRTVGIISSTAEAGGIEKALKADFPKRHIHSIKPEKDLADELFFYVDGYFPAFIHQLGWTPLTPTRFLQSAHGSHQNLNQHLGPGGRYMKGRRRIWTHFRFCEEVGRKMPIPVFSQLVGAEYDSGDIVYMIEVEIDPKEPIDSINKWLLPIEHAVQIEGRRRISTGEYKFFPVPKYAGNGEEEKLLRKIQKESVTAYPGE